MLKEQTAYLLDIDEEFLFKNYELGLGLGTLKPLPLLSSDYKEIYQHLVNRALRNRLENKVVLPPANSDPQN